jgi:hypothetical protein
MEPRSVPRIVAASLAVLYFVCLLFAAINMG